MKKVHQHRNITDEHREEASRLRSLWESHRPMSEMRPGRKMSQDEFGELYKIGNQSAMSHFLNATLQLNLDVALKFAKGLNISVADFSPRLAKEMAKIADAVPNEEDEFLPVNMLNVELSAGGGASGVEVVESVGALHFKRSYMSQQGINGHNSAIVSVRGESMEPTITNGAVVLINQNDTSPKNGNIYALILDGELIIKRLFFDAEKDKWIARSDNKKFDDRELNNSAIILGRAIWVGMSL